MEYHIFQESAEQDGLGRYETYGIRCGEATVHDVSPNKASAERIAALLNRCAVSPVHFFDIVEDCLQGGEIV